MNKLRWNKERRFGQRKGDAFRCLGLLLTTLFLIGLWTGSAQAQLNQGDILVGDQGDGTNNFGAIFLVDPSTGARTIFSDFGDPAQGPTGDGFGNGQGGVAIDSSGNILVGDNNMLFSVNPANGNRTVLSDFFDPAQGPTGGDPSGIAIDSSGNILVIAGELFTVDPSNGNRTLLSDFGDAAQGSLGVGPFGVAIDSNGDILVIDLSAGTGGLGALFRVDPSNGNRTVLSDFGDPAQGILGENPIGITIDSGGDILVIDNDAGLGPINNGALFVVEPSNGNRTLLSDFGDPAQGTTGSDPSGVAIDLNGDILVVDLSAGMGQQGALFRVDPSNGNRTLVSDFGAAAQGDLGVDPRSVAVLGMDIVPPPTGKDGGNGCALSGPVEIGATVANILIILIPTFAVGLRALRRGVRKNVK
jgi:sugar lactone lactonase YvrE